MTTVSLHPRIKDCRMRSHLRRVYQLGEERERALEHLRHAAKLASELKGHLGSVGLFDPFIEEFECVYRELEALDPENPPSRRELDQIAKRLQCIAALFRAVAQLLALSGASAGAASGAPGDR